jgi:hypothetical protein
MGDQMVVGPPHDETEHDVGDEGCMACTRLYPVRCSCGGLVHGSTSLADPDSGPQGGDYEEPPWQETEAHRLESLRMKDNEYVDTKCDRCGKTEEVIRKRWEPTPEESAEIKRTLDQARDDMERKGG